LKSRKGSVSFHKHLHLLRYPEPDTFTLTYWPARVLTTPDFVESRSIAGFLFANERYGYTVAAPHWFLVLLLGTFAVLFKPTPRLKFSLQDLLVLTTVTGVMTGLGVWIAGQLTL
jgi:hypothetical protein